MINVRAHDGSDITINLTNQHRSGNGEDIDVKVERALKLLRELAANAPLSEKALDAVEVVLDSDVCVTPEFFIGKRQLNKHVAHRLVAQDGFACELYDRLETDGVFEFTKRAHDPGVMEARLHRIVCIFAFCAIGQNSVDNITPGFVHAITSWFRTQDDLRWRPELEGSPETLQCLRATILGMSKIVDDATLIDRAGNRRAPYGGRNTVWKEFRNSTDRIMSDISRRLDDYLEWSLAKPDYAKSTARLIAEWLWEDHPGKLLMEVCSQQTRDRTFYEFLELKRQKSGRNLALLIASAKRMTDYFVDQLQSENIGTAFYPVVTENEAAKAKNNVSTPARPATARARPLPERLFAVAKSILDNEAGWARKSKLFHVEIRGKSVFCPVIPTLLRCAFDLPLRIVQFRRLDSGEGDVRRFDGQNMVWEENPGRFRGYWADIGGKPRKGYPERGYAHEFVNNGDKITGFWVNTNKTSEPYGVPWQNPDIHRRLWKLRLWQEKFNPIDAPLDPDRYLDDPFETPNATKQRMPHIFPLFRLFPTAARPWKGRIPTLSEMDHAWQNFMVEVERVWNLENPANPIQIVEYHPKNKQPQKARYTLHGIRVRGLTDLFRAGMPLEVLSKVVAGHATVRMTLYYTQFDPLLIDKQLTAAAVEARSQEAQQVMDDFARLSLEEAQRRTVSLVPAAIQEAHTYALGSALTFMNTDIGFCPFSCTRCHDGGPLKRSSEVAAGPSKSVYDRVPGGDGNCVMCRHLVTGPPWMLQLELHGTALLDRRVSLATREAECLKAMESLERQWRNEKIITARYRQAYDARQSELSRIKEEQAIVETSVFNIGVLLHTCIALQSDTSGGEQMPMIAGDRDSIVRYIETTEFENSLLQTKASRIYPILADARVEAARDNYLDAVLFDSGETPPRLIPQLTDDQRRLAMDQYADIMRYRVSEAQRKSLVKGDLKLADTDAWTDVRQIMHTALNNSIELLTDESPRRSEIDEAVLEVLK
jgi:hypothetical protein